MSLPQDLGLGKANSKLFLAAFQNFTRGIQ